MKILVLIQNSKKFGEIILVEVYSCCFTDFTFTLVVDKTNLTQEMDEALKQYEKERSESNNLVRIKLKNKVSKNHFLSVDRENETILYSFYL